MRLLVFGGSFDPPHRGHLQLLSAALSNLRPDRALVVPAFQAPLKGRPGASPAEREALLRLALKALPAAWRPKVRVLRWELERGRLGYTYELLRRLRREHPGAELHLLIGSDSLASFRRWRRWREVAASARLVVGRRPGNPAAAASGGPAFTLLPGVFPEDSSTELRRRLAMGEDPGPLLDPAVAERIRRRGVYGTRLQAWLREHLSKHRYEHTLAVARLAEDLASAHGLDAGAARSAGLLHDAGRSMDPSRLAAYVKRHDLRAPEREAALKHAPMLLHAYASAHLARTVFGVRDRSVLSAVERHTLGAGRMGPLDKLLYVADAASEDRSHRGAASLRRLAYRDLDAALAEAARRKLAHARGLGLWIHPAGARLCRSLS